MDLIKAELNPGSGTKQNGEKMFDRGEKKGM